MCTLCGHQIRLHDKKGCVVCAAHNRKCNGKRCLKVSRG